MKPVIPTDSEEECSKGRFALWLCSDRIAFIANEWSKIPETAPIEVKKHWADIVFRAMSALHKAGIAYEPVIPNDSAAYHLTTRSSGRAEADR